MKFRNSTPSPTCTSVHNIVLRPTLAGAGDYKELRRIPLPKYNKDSRRVPKGPV